MVKNLPAMQEIWVRSLGREDPLEDPLQYSCLENSMDREPGGPQSMRSQRVGMTERLIILYGYINSK